MARKTWAQIAEEQAQFQAVDQKPPGWTARKKSARSIGAAGCASKGQDLGVARPGWQRYSSCAPKLLSPSPLRLLAFYGPLDPLPATNFPESALLA